MLKDDDHNFTMTSQLLRPEYPAQCTKVHVPKSLKHLQDLQMLPLPMFGFQGFWLHWLKWNLHQWHQLFRQLRICDSCRTTEEQISRRVHYTYCTYGVKSLCSQVARMFPASCRAWTQHLLAKCAEVVTRAAFMIGWHTPAPGSDSRTCWRRLVWTHQSSACTV